MPGSRKRIADVAFLLALMAYVLAGVIFTPMHADEFMQMAMARDTFYIAHGQWNQIAFTPPVQPDSEQYLRLINGTINKMLIGVVWRLSGGGADRLPGTFAWAMPFVWNQRKGNIPRVDLLDLARCPPPAPTAPALLPPFFLVSPPS